MCEETCGESGFSHTILGTSVLEWSQMKTDQWVKYEENINFKMNTFTLYSNLNP